MAKAPDLKPNGRPRADDGKGTKQVPLSKGGNDRLAARLKRDHPEIAARVAAGDPARTPLDQSEKAAKFIRLVTLW